MGYSALVGSFRPKMSRAAAAFVPTDIAGLQLWLKADAGLYQDAAMTTLAVLDADPVGGWADQSGNANHATQATVDNRPLLKLAIQNSKAVVRFRESYSSLRTAAFSSALHPKTIILVYSQPSTSAQTYVFDGLASNQTQLDSQAPNVNAAYAGAYIFYTESYPLAMCVMSIIFNGANSFMIKNGIQQAVGDTGTTAMTGLTLGASGGATGSGLVGDIAEFLIYNSALSTANRQAVESYLNSRWAVY